MPTTAKWKSRARPTRVRSFLCICRSGRVRRREAAEGRTLAQRAAVMEQGDHGASPMQRATTTRAPDPLWSRLRPVNMDRFGGITYLRLCLIFRTVDALKL